MFDERPLGLIESEDAAATGAIDGWKWNLQSKRLNTDTYRYNSQANMQNLWEQIPCTIRKCIAEIDPIIFNHSEINLKIDGIGLEDSNFITK